MSDTIAAIATPAGRGGVGIVRISGPAVNDIARAVCGRLPDPRVAEVVVFRDSSGEALDQGVALRFAAPRSYTGEDVLELQGHGGPVVLSGLLERVLALGARLARPGEFTQRAFLNDKLDLAQAEAVADLIDAGSAAAARAALRSLQGAFSDEVKVLTEALVELRVWVEAAIDFADEDIDFLADQALHARLERLHGRFDEVLRAAQQGRVLRDGMTVVIAGRPNAGKSTLLNALCGHDAAIVTDLPGTTRDVLREHLHLDGMPVHLVDTAGLRHAEEAAADPVETEGIRRARLEMARADRVLFVIDAVADPAAQSWLEERAVQPDAVPVTVFLNKSDALDATPTPTVAMLPGATTVLRGSARTGDGLDALRQHLKDCMGYDGAHAGTLSARVRHLEALGRARTHAEAAVALLVERRAGELVAEELRLAQRHLDDITGEFHADDLLGRIFGSFCIGK